MQRAEWFPRLVEGLHAVGCRSADGRLLIRNRATGALVLIGQPEWALLQRFDGSSLCEIHDRIAGECGREYDLDALVAFIKRAERTGVLETRGVQEAQEVRRGQGVQEAREVQGVRRVQEVQNRSEACGGVLDRPILVLGLAVIVFALRSLWQRPLASSAPEPLSLRLCLWVLVFHGVAYLHESGHALALRRLGGERPRIGIRWCLFWPCWHCDVSGLYLLRARWQQACVLLAGSAAQAVAASAVVLLATDLRRLVPLADALREAGALVGALTLANLVPLARTDGYYLLSVLLRVPNLRRLAFAWLLQREERYRLRARLPRRTHAFLAAYAVSLVAIPPAFALVIVIALWFKVRR